MKIILPPKRFQEVNDPIYDPIRFRPWFARLGVRREKIDLLRMASSALAGMTQKAAAEMYKVDPRELRDFVAFQAGETSIPKESRKTLQMVLDLAYLDYCGMGARYHIIRHLHDLAPSWGLNKRHVGEFWDVDPTYYPSGYEQRP